MTARRSEKLFLLDGTALAYRSHFAFARKPLLTSRGRNVGALFAYTGALIRILDRESPDLIAAAFDRPEPTFRHELFKDYKATRDKTPGELVEQLPDIKAFTEAFGVRILEKPGWEADDLIGTLARRGEEEGLEVFIVAGDKDFMQLVSERVKMYTPARAEAEAAVQDARAVREKFGVDPGRVVEILGLMGDASDNVPGVPGVGIKTAINLIREFGTIENLYENLDKVPAASLRKKLEENREKAFLSRDLVVIDTNAPVDVSLDLLAPGKRDVGFLKKKFLDLEFNSYIPKLGEITGSAGDERSYRLVDDPEGARALLKRIRGRKKFAFDLETTSLDPRDAEIVGIAVALDEHEAFYVPAIAPGRLFTPEKAVAPLFLAGLEKILADPGFTVIGQNIKYDLAVLRRAGITGVRGRIFDTMVAHYLVHPGALQHGLDFLSLKYFGVKKIPTKDLIGRGKKQITMADVPVERVMEYACEDVDMTLRLEKVLAAELEEAGLGELFHGLEMPLLLVLETMEANGVKVDRGMLEKIAAEYRDRIAAVSAEIFELAGEEFNINSTRQLGRILFEKLEVHKEIGLKRLRRTKTGYSTDASVLESLSSHPLGRLLLEYRRLQKLNSTYIEALPKLIHPRTGCVHTSFNQAVTATGRLSSSDPNLQNIPVRTEEGRKIREAFVPREEGWRIVSADYSQIELRILAHVSGDEKLVTAFKKGGDVHRETAALIFGLPPGEVTDEMRSRAKTINFGIIYGMGPQRLAREVGISFDEARRFIDAYFAAYPGVKAYIESTLTQARERGFVSTLLGRKRRVDDILSPNQQVRANVENIAVNTPIQGTAADLIKRAMIDIHRAMEEGRMRSKMILQVHDELVFDVPPEETEAMIALARDKMEGAARLDVPLLVDAGAGGNWSEAH